MLSPRPRGLGFLAASWPRKCPASGAGRVGRPRGGISNPQLMPEWKTGWTGQGTRRRLDPGQVARDRYSMAFRPTREWTSVRVAVVWRPGRLGRGRRRTGGNRALLATCRPEQRRGPSSSRPAVRASARRNNAPNDMGRPLRVRKRRRMGGQPSATATRHAPSFQGLHRPGTRASDSSLIAGMELVVPTCGRAHGSCWCK